MVLSGYSIPLPPRLWPGPGGGMMLAPGMFSQPTFTPKLGFLPSSAVGVAATVGRSGFGSSESASGTVSRPRGSICSAFPDLPRLKKAKMPAIEMALLIKSMAARNAKEGAMTCIPASSIPVPGSTDSNACLGAATENLWPATIGLVWEMEFHQFCSAVSAADFTNEDPPPAAASEVAGRLAIAVFAVESVVIGNI